MRIRIAIAVSGLLALVSAPVTSQAGAADRAVDACVRAFVDTHVPKDRVVHLVKEKSPRPTTQSRHPKIIQPKPFQ